MRNSDTFQAAEQLVRVYGTRDPFALIAAAPELKLWPSEAYGPDGLKGYATIQNRTKYIVINQFLSPEEQAVVAAHELGHIFRHELHLKAQPMKDFDIYGATGKLEREANFFGADFLISDEQALDEIHSCDADFFSVAKILGVPAPFFAFKLYSLVQRGNAMRVPVDLSNTFLDTRRNRS